MILLTGGSGRLGTELQKHIKCYAPSHADFDILAPRWPADVSLVVHCAAYTDVLRAEKDGRQDCYALNVVGTRHMAERPIVYISTEYVFDGAHGYYTEGDEPNPVNTYAHTKLLGEIMAREAPRSLIIRCLFKPRPFQHPRACTDQFTSGDYVDVVARQVALCVERFADFDAHDTIHIGTGRKSTYDLARQTRDVEPIKRADVGVKLPRDTSLNLQKFNELSKAENGY